MLKIFSDIYSDIYYIIEINVEYIVFRAGYDNGKVIDPRSYGCRSISPGKVCKHCSIKHQINKIIYNVKAPLTNVTTKSFLN